MCNSPEVPKVVPILVIMLYIHQHPIFFYAVPLYIYIHTYIIYIYKYTYISGAYEGVEGLWPQPYCPSGGEEPLRVSQLHDSDMFVDRFV